MKSEQILDAIGMLPEDMIETAQRLRSGDSRNARERKKKTGIRKKWIQNGLITIAAAGLIVGICFFAAMINKDELLPNTDPVELSSEIEEFSEAVETIEDETTINEAESDETAVERSTVSFMNGLEMIVNEQYVFSVKDGILSAVGKENAVTISENLSSEVLVSDGNILYFTTRIEGANCIAALDMATLEHKEIYREPAKVLSNGSYASFYLCGMLDEYLIYCSGFVPEGQTKGTNSLYSLHLEDDIVVSLPQSTEKMLGYGDYLVSMGSWCGPSVDRLYLEKVDGSESRILTEYTSGAIIIDGVIYYQDHPDYLKNDKKESWLVGYDLDEQKEIGRVECTGGWWQNWNNCLARYGGTGRETNLVLPDGTVVEYPSGFSFFRLENQYFAATQSRIYRLDPENGSYMEILTFDVESSTESMQYKFSLLGDYVYMNYGDGEYLVWDKAEFGLDEEAEIVQSKEERLVKERLMDWKLGKYASTVLPLKETYRLEDGTLYYWIDNSHMNVISGNIEIEKLMFDEQYIYYTVLKDGESCIMRFDMETEINEVLYAQPAEPYEQYSMTYYYLMELMSVTDDYLYFRYGKNNLAQNKLYSISRKDGSVYFLAENVQDVFIVDDSYVAVTQYTAEVRPGTLYLCASDGSETRLIAEECNGAVAGTVGLQYLDCMDESTYLVSYDVTGGAENERILLSPGYWSAWNDCFYEADNHKVVWADKEIALPEGMYPVRIEDQMCVYSEDTIYQADIQAEEIQCTEMLSMSVPDDVMAYRYLFEKKGNLMTLRIPGQDVIVLDKIRLEK